MSASPDSKLVQRGALLYVHALATRTSQALDEVDRLLAQAGSHKSKLLTAQVRLRDMGLADEHDAAWRAWVDPARPPVVARAQAELPGSHMVELMLTASR